VRIASDTHRMTRVRGEDTSLNDTDMFLHATNQKPTRRGVDYTTYRP